MSALGRSATTLTFRFRRRADINTAKRLQRSTAHLVDKSKVPRADRPLRHENQNALSPGWRVHTRCAPFTAS